MHGKIRGTGVDYQLGYVASQLPTRMGSSVLASLFSCSSYFAIHTLSVMNRHLRNKRHCLYRFVLAYDCEFLLTRIQKPGIDIYLLKTCLAYIIMLSFFVSTATEAHAISIFL